MTKAFARAVTFVLLLVCSSATDNHGTEFFTAFPKNIFAPIISSPRLHVTTEEPGTVTFTIHTVLGQQTLNVTHGLTTTVDIEPPDLLTVTSNTQLNRTIRIQTKNNKTISVYATNHVLSSAGAFAVLPLHEYSNLTSYTYYAISSSTMISQRKSYILLVSGHQPNSISITPTQSVVIPTVVTGLSYNVTVQPNQSYQFNLNSSTTFLLESQSDLTGTKIVSAHPLAVVTGHECGNVPGQVGFCDHMIQQIPPINTWGRVYMSLPLAKRTSGSTYKIMAGVNDTDVVASCTNGTNQLPFSYQLNEGSFVTFMVPAGFRCSIVGNGGILVTQFAEGGKDEGLGDPMSMSLVPVEQYTNVSSLVVPTSTFLETSALKIENMLHLFVVDNTTDINITVDDVLISNWTSVYSGSNLLGYGASVVDLSSNYHVIKSYPTVLMSVLAYGFTSENQAYGYPLNTGLNSLSAEPFVFKFSTSNYTVIEGAEHLLPILRLNELDEAAVIRVQGCDGSPLPDNVVIDDPDIEFGPGQHSKNVHLTISDDKELSKVQCFCLEAVKTQQVHPYFSPFTTTNICITDNEDVRLDVTAAKVVDNDEGRYLELSLSMTGFEGETDMKITIQPNIFSAASYKRSASSTSLPSFNVYFTKYLSTTTFRLPLSQDVILSNSFISIDTLDDALNINATVDPIEVTIPVLDSSITPSPTPLTTTTTQVSTMTTLITYTARLTPSPVLFSEAYRFVADNSSAFFFIFIALAVVLLILLVLNCLFCGLYVCQRAKNKQPTTTADHEKDEIALQSYRASTVIQSETFPSPSHTTLQIESSYVNIPSSHEIRCRSESPPSHSQRSSNGSTYSDTLPNKPHHLNHLHHHLHTSGTSSNNSISGSADMTSSCDPLCSNP